MNKQLFGYYPKVIYNKENKMLTPKESQILDKYYKKMINKYKDLSMSPNLYEEDNSLCTVYIVQNNFVICQLLYRGSYLRVGVAKRNPVADEWNIERAKDISLYRALASNQVIYIDSFILRTPGL